MILYHHQGWLIMSSISGKILIFKIINNKKNNILIFILGTFYVLKSLYG